MLGTGPLVEHVRDMLVTGGQEPVIVAVPMAPGVSTRTTISAFFAATPETWGVTSLPVTTASLM